MLVRSSISLELFQKFQRILFCRVLVGHAPWREALAQPFHIAHILETTYRFWHYTDDLSKPRGSRSREFLFEFEPYLSSKLSKHSSLQVCMFHRQIQKYSRILDHDEEFFYHARIWGPLSYALKLSIFLIIWIDFYFLYEFGSSLRDHLRQQTTLLCIKSPKFHHKKLIYIRWYFHRHTMLKFLSSLKHFISTFLS